MHPSFDSLHRPRVGWSNPVVQAHISFALTPTPTPFPLPQGWRLFLRDMKARPGADQTMAAGAAASLGPLCSRSGGGPDRAAVERELSRLPCRVGRLGDLPLLDVLAPGCVDDVVRACADFSRDL